ncbi:MAG TPA: hypothetical protein VIG32_08610 [Candidatus Baltobacteraceae bacterium]|jgi:hypothetical protein
MSFILKWLRIEKPSGASLRPSRVVEVPRAYDAAFDRCVDGIERVLGGVVRESDRAAGTVEATFGLTFSERLTCSLDPLDAQRTRARIESRRGAQPQARVRSDYVDRLAEYLTND